MRRSWLLVLALLGGALLFVVLARSTPSGEESEGRVGVASKTVRATRDLELRRVIRNQPHLEVAAEEDAEIGATLQGIVLDSVSRRAVAGAAVSIHRGPQAAAGPTAGGSTTTDERGAFSFGELLERASVALTVKAEGYAPRRVELALAEEDGEVLVLLDRLARVVGQVLDQAGKPLRVRIDLRDLEGQSQTSDTTTDEGRYALDKIPPGEHLLSAGHILELPGVVQRVALKPGETLVQDLVLEDQGVSASIRGSVEDSLGQPLYGAEVRIRPEQAPRDDLERVRLVEAGAQTSLDGTFSMSTPGSGWYVVEVGPYLGTDDEVLSQVRLLATTDPSPQPIKVPGRATRCRLLDDEGRAVAFDGATIMADVGGSGFAGYSASALHLIWSSRVRTLEVGLRSDGLEGEVTLRTPGDQCAIAGAARPDRGRTARRRNLLVETRLILARAP